MILIGIGLILQPEQALKSLNMPMLEGLALSTQLGDMTSFFLCTGAFIIMGAYHTAPRWLYAGAALFALAAIARTVSWQVYGADFALQPIVVEVISTIWLVACGILMGKHLRVRH